MDFFVKFLILIELFLLPSFQAVVGQRAANIIEKTFITDNLSLTKEFPFEYLNNYKRHPYLISLQQGFKTGKHFCNGVLVGRDTVLTAVLCCHRDNFRLNEVYAVGGTQDSTDRDDTAIYNRVVFCMKHPKDTKNFVHSLGLLRLENSFVFSDKIRPIKMAFKSLPRDEGYFIAAGWGSFYNSEVSLQSMGIMKVIRLKVVDDTTCNANSIIPYYNNKYVFCAYVTAKLFNTGGGICVYDHGTPLIHNHILYGLAINNILCNIFNEETEYNYFNKIEYYRDWINEVTPIEFRYLEIPVKDASFGDGVNKISFSKYIVNLCILLHFIK